MLTISSDAVTALLTLAIPVAVALITKSSASARLKGVVSIILAGVVTLIGNSRIGAGGPAVLSLDSLASWGTGIGASVASYLGLWQKVGINSLMAPGVGIGRTAPTGE